MVKLEIINGQPYNAKIKKSLFGKRVLYFELPILVDEEQREREGELEINLSLMNFGPGVAGGSGKPTITKKVTLKKDCKCVRFSQKEGVLDYVENIRHALIKSGYLKTLAKYGILAR